MDGSRLSTPRLTAVTDSGARPSRVALVHDFLLDLRGAERVFLELCEMWPEADIFTAVYDEVGTEGRFAHRNVNTSFLQRLRPSSRTFRALLPVYPYAVEAMDLRGYDLVISSSSAWAHGAIAGEGAVHVCYCHNPFRYAWNARESTLAGRPWPVRAALGVVFNRWRQWDWIAAQHVDRYIANSETTRRRIDRSFGREATVVYPPVETTRFSPGTVGPHYLVVSELMPHKRIDVAVEAFTRLRLPLVVVGDGPELRRLRRLAGSSVQFAGRVSDETVAELMRTCQALVVTATEEFGIAAVEAQAAGRPVVALAAGGVRETVVEGVTGTFYRSDHPDALVEALQDFDPLAIDPQGCVENAGRFDVAHFREGLLEVIADASSVDPPAPRTAPRRQRLRPTGRIARM